MIFEIDLQEQETPPAEPLPRVLPKTNDPNIAKRNRRMFGALIGTLEVGFQLLFCACLRTTLCMILGHWDTKDHWYEDISTLQYNNCVYIGVRFERTYRFHFLNHICNNSSRR
jgi:hypothetical protein